MHYFDYRGDTLYCDDCGIPEIAEAVGTPFYLYSSRTLLRHARNLDRAFEGLPHLVCYSVKANANLALLHLLGGQGIGADIVSGGELYKARRAGIPASKIVYSGVGKTEEEIRYALEEGILAFNVESMAELDAIDRVTGGMGRRAPVMLRINPDVDPRTHPYISTGLKKSKFGIPHPEAIGSFKIAASKPHVRVIGIDAHIGSQITSVGPFAESAQKLAGLVAQIRAEGIDLQYVDIGGGLGIRYKDEEPPEPAEWAAAITPALQRTGCGIIYEPGRSMVGNVGILVTKVLYIKRNEGKTFVIVDAGMNDLLRPSLYDSYHEIRPVLKSDGRTIVADVVGPVCESGDFLARDREIAAPQSGDLLAVLSAGAYGSVMSSHYNARPKVPEVLALGDRFEIVRERETYEDLVRGERTVRL